MTVVFLTWDKKPLNQFYGSNGLRCFRKVSWIKCLGLFFFFFVGNSNSGQFTLHGNVSRHAFLEGHFSAELCLSGGSPYPLVVTLQRKLKLYNPWSSCMKSLCLLYLAEIKGVLCIWGICVNSAVPHWYLELQQDKTTQNSCKFSFVFVETWYIFYSLFCQLTELSNNFLPSQNLICNSWMKRIDQILWYCNG